MPGKRRPQGFVSSEKSVRWRQLPYCVPTRTRRFIWTRLLPLYSAQRPSLRSPLSRNRELPWLASTFLAHWLQREFHGPSLANGFGTASDHKIAALVDWRDSVCFDSDQLH